jgi:hypothetical protein
VIHLHIRNVGRGTLFVAQLVEALRYKSEGRRFEVCAEQRYSTDASTELVVKRE